MGSRTASPGGGRSADASILRRSCSGRPGSFAVVWTLRPELSRSNAQGRRTRGAVALRGRLQSVSVERGDGCEKRGDTLEKLDGQARPAEKGTDRTEADFLCVADRGRTYGTLVRQGSDGRSGTLSHARQDPRPESGQDLCVAGLLADGAIQAAVPIPSQASLGTPGTLPLIVGRASCPSPGGLSLRGGGDGYGEFGTWRLVLSKIDYGISGAARGEPPGGIPPPSPFDGG